MSRKKRGAKSSSLVLPVTLVFLGLVAAAEGVAAYKKCVQRHKKEKYARLRSAEDTLKFFNDLGHIELLNPEHSLSSELVMKVTSQNRKKYLLKLFPDRVNVFRECNIQRLLPDISPKIIDCFVCDGVNYPGVNFEIQGVILMEYLEGWKDMGKLPEKGTKLHEIVCGIVNTMHDRGVVHQDLHENNMMINKDETDAKIIDFGHARITYTSPKKDGPWSKYKDVEKFCVSRTSHNNMT